MLTYPVELTPDDNGTLLVTCPDLPEVTSFGSDEADALVQAGKAVAEALAARLDAFEPIPCPRSGSTRRVATVGTQLGMKVLLFWKLLDTKQTRADLARLMGTRRVQVDRLFDPHHATRLSQYDTAFQALQFRLEVAAVAA